MSECLPHDNVFVRLAPSGIHGVGVFACEPIEPGTNVFSTDQGEIRWVPATILEDPSLNDFQRSLYRDFAIRRGDKLGCPPNFNLLTVGWYLNEPGAGRQANVASTPDFNLVSTRYIAQGEELTLDYSTFARVSSGSDNTVE